jgi:arsenical pump membrane protein
MYPTWTAAGAGTVVALVSNLINNLPAGLVAGSTVQLAHMSDKIAGAVLIGVDLGPNLSITGSPQRYCGQRRCVAKACKLVPGHS